MSTADTGHAKRIKVFRNGDKTYLGKDFVLNKRKTRTFESFLNTITTELKVPLPVRNIRTPVHGTRIDTLEGLEKQQNIVAVTTGGFKHIRYDQLGPVIPVPRPSPRNNVMDRHQFGDVAPVKPVVHSNAYQRFSGRARKVPTGALTILVYSNGSEHLLEPAHRLTFPHVQLKGMSWNKFCDSITERVNLNATCMMLYKLPGQDGESTDVWEKITDIQQLEHTKQYVAVAKRETLKRLDYGSHKPSFFTSPKLSRNKNSKHGNKVFYLKKIGYEPGAYNNTKNNRKSRASDTSNSTTQSSATNETSQRSRGYGLGRPSPSNERSPARNTRKPPQRRPPPQKQEDDIYHGKQKPVKHQRGPENYKEVDYDKDEGGIYKAKGLRRETSGAQEVEETRDTQVDLPIDQVEAEEVKDEEIEEDKKQTRKGRRSPSPEVPLTYRKSPSHRTPTPKSRNESYHSLVMDRTPTPVHRTPTPVKRTPTPVKRTPTPVQRTPTPRERTPSPERVESPQKIRSPTPEKQPTPAPRSRESSRRSTRVESAKSAKQDNNDEEVERREKAAVKIQSNYKGYKTRKYMQKRKEQRIQKDKTRTPTPTTAPTPPPRSRASSRRSTKSHRSARLSQHSRTASVQESQPSQEEQDAPTIKRQTEAAITIQAGYRGYKARRDIKHMKRLQKQQEEEHRRREEQQQQQELQQEQEKELKQKEEERIQEDKQKQEEQQQQLEEERLKEEQEKAIEAEKQENKAATKIQSKYRGYKVRKEFSEQQTAASKIQANYKGYKTRKTRNKQSDAAVKIQSNYRGYASRKRVATIRAEREVDRCEAEVRDQKDQETGQSDEQPETSQSDNPENKQEGETSQSENPEQKDGETGQSNVTEQQNQPSEVQDPPAIDNMAENQPEEQQQSEESNENQHEQQNEEENPQ